MNSRNIYLFLFISSIVLTACPPGDEEEFTGVVGAYIMDSFSLSSRRSFINSEGEEIGLLQSEDQMLSSDYIVEFFEDGTFYGEGPIEFNLML